MTQRELLHILAAIIIFTIVASFSKILEGNFQFLAQALLFSVIIIIVSISAKKIVANLLDSDVEHELWFAQRYGYKKSWHLKKPIPAGIIFPLFFSIFSLGLLKVLTFLTYETKALKRRAARRYGPYSYTEMTDWHNGLIGAAGIAALIILAVVVYFIPFANHEFLTKLTVYYAFWNLIPWAKFDGSQIFFGSRILWIFLSIITVIATLLALLVF
tara:strand:+ start:5219 stop:5863 length:645 start_codon:yes stop_codon:yes gene_type:complete